MIEDIYEEEEEEEGFDWIQDQLNSLNISNILHFSNFIL